MSDGNALGVPTSMVDRTTRVLFGLPASPITPLEHAFYFLCVPMGRRYDVKSVSPRHVEALLVDTLRLRDPRQVRRVLQGYPGLPDTKGQHAQARPRTPTPPPQQHQHQQPRAGDRDSGEEVVAGRDDDDDGGEGRREKNGCGSVSDMPELLATLSRAVEEEIRGSKGLFGLETGVLERLKGGAKVTPFLRHGSVRRRESMGAAPNGLAAGGMKKWWRCPRCHISQVCALINLWLWESYHTYLCDIVEAIVTTHSEVLLVDTAEVVPRETGKQACVITLTA